MASFEYPLDAGSVVVHYRLQKHKASFDKYKADLAALVAATEAADKKLTLTPRVRGETAEEWFRKLGTTTTAARQEWDKTTDHVKRNPIQPAIDPRAVSRYEATLSKMQRAAQMSNRRINQFLKFGAYGGGAIGAGLGAAFIGAGVEYAKFEDQMYKVQAISGATAKQMDLLRESAKKLAMEGRYSQQELAEAQVELVKGGMEAADLYGGGLRTAYLLASAGQIELADAAMYTVNAMNLFNISSNDAIKIADGFAAAANITTASVDDFGMALTQGGAAAKTAGLSFEDTMVWLEALAKMGIKNSDAGTSLKSAIIQATAGLSPRAREIMKLIGLDLFNAKGELKQINEITQELVDSVGQYDRESQINILGQIFGSDGVRSAIALLEQGTAGVEKLGKETRKQGESARVTSIQNQGLAFAWTNMKNTLGVVAAEGFAPFDKNVTSAFKNLQGWLKSTAPALREFSERINKILEADMPWREKVRAIWDELANSDAAEGLKVAISTALSFVPDLIAKAAVATFQALPGILVDAFKNSSALGKVALTTLLLAKFGPAIGAVGKALGGVFSKIPGVGGLLDKLFGGRGTTMANPLYVWTVNGGPGVGGPGGKGRKGPGGGPVPPGGGRGVPKDRPPGLPRTAPKAGPGVLGRITQWGGKALPWLAGIPMAGLAANPITLGVVASVLGGGALAWGLSGQGPLSKKADRRAGKRFGAQMWKQKARNFFNEREDLLEGDPRTRGKRIKSAMKEELKNVPAQFRAAWAQGAIIWAKEMEGAKRLSRGTAADIRTHLVGSMKVISRQSAKAAWNYRAAIGGMNMTTLALIGNAKRAGVSMDKVARAAQRARSQAGKVLSQAASAIRGVFASGGYVSGPRGQGVPVMLHGDEAVLNSEQMDMIGRDRIMAVLGATGAQTISAGGSYAKGGKPAKGAGTKRPDAELQARLENKPSPAEQRRKAAEAARKRRARAAAEARQNPSVPGAQKFQDQERALNIKLARAEGTTDYDDTTTKDLGDDLAASRALEKLYGKRKRALEGMQRKYKLRGKGAWPQMRREVDAELEQVISSHNRIKADIRSLTDTIKPKKDPNEQDLTAPQDADIENLQRAIRIREARGGSEMTAPERETLLSKLTDKLTWLEDKLKKAVGPKLKELRERLKGEIDDTAGEMISLRDQAKSSASSTQQSIISPAQEFAAARQDLYREFGSNTRPMPTGGAFAGFDAGMVGSGGGARGGTMVTQNITIAEPPQNAHAFAQKLAWETRTAL